MTHFSIKHSDPDINDVHKRKRNINAEQQFISYHPAPDPGETGRL